MPSKTENARFICSEVQAVLLICYWIFFFCNLNKPTQKKTICFLWEFLPCLLENTKEITQNCFTNSLKTRNGQNSSISCLCVVDQGCANCGSQRVVDFEQSAARERLTRYYFVSDLLTQILCLVPQGAQSSEYMRLCVKYRTLCNRPNKPRCDVTFARKFLRGKQITTCEQITACAVVVDCFSDRSPTRGWARVGNAQGRHFWWK